MFISTFTDRGAVPALVNTLAFNEARLRVVSENIANWGTVGYHAKRLNPKAFQGALREALDRRGGDPNKPLEISGDEAETRRASGTGIDTLEVTPSDLPPENILHHDGTNMSLERQMADLAETQLQHQVASELLRGRMNGLRKAIRGTP